MIDSGLFINSAGRLRSVWRFIIFCLVFLVVFFTLALLAHLALVFVTDPARFYAGEGGFILQGVLLLFAATLVGWLCNLLLEELPWRALGWALHRGWGRDLLLGSLLGAAAMGVAVVISVVFGDTSFAPAPDVASTAVARTLFVSAVVFLFGAAAEEALFRGYLLQTLMRSWPSWVALLLTSILFALVHLSNPNFTTAFAFAFLNTALAGVWLAVAYVRTRSLWFAFGLHWSWNWTMGALLGLPVSGIRDITPDPILRATDAGPAWLTGGAYGPEGGLAATLAILAATLFIYKTNLAHAAEELKEFTDHENPRHPDALSITH